MPHVSDSSTGGTFPMIILHHHWRDVSPQMSDFLTPLGPAAAFGTVDSQETVLLNSVWSDPDVETHHLP